MWKTDGEGFFNVMRERNMEGMIAKKKDSRYYPGGRSREWLKIKHQQIDEAVIAGFTAPKGGRKYFGSLIVGAIQRRQVDVCRSHRYRF